MASLDFTTNGRGRDNKFNNAFSSNKNADGINSTGASQKKKKKKKKPKQLNNSQNILPRKDPKNIKSPPKPRYPTKQSRNAAQCEKAKKKENKKEDDCLFPHVNGGWG